MPAATSSLATASIPRALFVGRITRQKGVTYALDAASQFDPGAQFVLCAGAPDTPEIAAEIEAKVARVREERGNIIWIVLHARPRGGGAGSTRRSSCAPRSTSPWASSTWRRWPARQRWWRRTRTPEVVEDGVTGRSCRLSRATTALATRSTTERFAGDIAERVNDLLADPARAARMGVAGRARAIAALSWPAIAERDRRALPASSGSAG